MNFAFFGFGCAELGTGNVGKAKWTDELGRGNSARLFHLLPPPDPTVFGVLDFANETQ